MNLLHTNYFLTPLGTLFVITLTIYMYIDTQEIEENRLKAIEAEKAAVSS